MAIAIDSPDKVIWIKFCFFNFFFNNKKNLFSDLYLIKFHKTKIIEKKTTKIINYQ